MFPARTCSAAAGSAAIARSTSSPSPSSSARQRPEALALDDLARIPALLDEPRQHLAGGVAADLLGLDHRRQRREALGRDLACGRVAVGADPLDQLRDPVRELDRIDLALVSVARRRRRAPARSSRPARSGTRTGARVSGLSPSSFSKPRRALGRQLGGQLGARGGEHLLGGQQRDQVGLGEVAVVVRLLLGAQRRERAGRGVEVQRLLDDRLAASSSPICRSISARTPRSRKRNEFMFLSSVLVPSSVDPAGRTDTLASQRSDPSSMLTSETPSWLSVARSSAEPIARLLGRAQVGLGHDLDQRRAAAVEVDPAAVRAVDPAARPRGG